MSSRDDPVAADRAGRVSDARRHRSLALGIGRAVRARHRAGRRRPDGGEVRGLPPEAARRVGGRRSRLRSSSLEADLRPEARRGGGNPRDPRARLHMDDRVLPLMWGSRTCRRCPGRRVSPRLPRRRRPDLPLHPGTRRPLARRPWKGFRRTKGLESPRLAAASASTGCAALAGRQGIAMTQKPGRGQIWRPPLPS